MMQGITVIEERTSGEMNRDRPTSQSPLIRFGPDPTDGFEVFFDPKVLHYLQAETQLAAPDETIGLLAGRWGHDLDGPYSLISEAESALDGEAETTPGSVRLPGVGRRRIEQRLTAKSSILDTVGWWHSHPQDRAYFSGPDSQEQGTWPDNRMVGIVVSGIDVEEPFAVFRGPGATPLPRASQLPAKERPSDGSLLTVVSPPCTIHLPLNIAVEPQGNPLNLHLRAVPLTDEQLLRLTRGLITLAMLMLVPGFVISSLVWLVWLLMQ